MNREEKNKTKRKSIVFLSISISTLVMHLNFARKENKIPNLVYIMLMCIALYICVCKSWVNITEWIYFTYHLCACNSLLLLFLSFSSFFLLRYSSFILSLIRNAIVAKKKMKEKRKRGKKRCMSRSLTQQNDRFTFLFIVKWIDV